MEPDNLKIMNIYIFDKLCIKRFILNITKKRLECKQNILNLIKEAIDKENGTCDRWMKIK